MEDSEPYNGKPVDDPSKLLNTVSKERRAELEAAGLARLRRYSDFLLGKDDPRASSIQEVQALNHASLEERAIFERFERVNSWCVGIRGDVFTKYAHLHQALDSISNMVNTAILCEGFIGYQDRVPEIMTGKEFVNRRKKAVEGYLTKDGAEIPQSAFDLFIIAVEYWLAHLQKHPAASNPLSTLLEQYQIEQVKSSFILEKWNRANKNGFYVFKSGLKSGIMTRGEFDEFLIREQQFDLDDIIKNYFGSRVHNLERDMFHDRESLDGIKWHVATGKPRSAVKKWQAVQVLGKLYNGQVGVEDMVNEFPGLVGAISEQVKKDFKIDLASVPIKDWKQPLTTRRKLYEMDFYLQRRNAETFYKNGAKTGVAVVQDEWEPQSEGHYEKPKPETYIESSLEGFFGVDGPAKIKRLKLTRFTIESSYYYIRGFACATELIAEIFDLPGFRRLAVPTSSVDRLLGGVKSRIETLFETVRKLPPGKNRLKKLQVIKDYFLFPEWEKVEIPRENVHKARRLIKSLDAFQPRYFFDIYSLLLKHPAPKEETP